MRINLALEKAKEFLFKRQLSYKQVFRLDDAAAKEVFDDLEKFCRANDPCFHPDPRIHAQLEGRREVYLRIRDHLFLESEELLNKYDGRKA